MWKKAEDHLLKDKYIAPLINRWGSCRIKPIKSTKYFEDLCASIIEQQLSGKAAETIFNRFKKKVGKVSPQNVLQTKDQELRDSGMSWGKVGYVKDLASKVASSELDVQALMKQSDEEIINSLTRVKGVGRWTAEMFLMFSLGRQDIFPLDDLGIQKGFVKTTGKKWDRKVAAAFAEKHWSPYRTAASWYLWRSLEA